MLAAALALAAVFLGLEFALTCCRAIIAFFFAFATAVLRALLAAALLAAALLALALLAAALALAFALALALAFALALALLAAALAARAAAVAAVTSGGWGWELPFRLFALRSKLFSAARFPTCLAIAIKFSLSLFERFMGPLDTFSLFDVLLAPLTALNGPLGEFRPLLPGFTGPLDTFSLFDVLLAPLTALNGPLGEFRPLLPGFTDPPDTLPVLFSIAEFRLPRDLLRFPILASLFLKFLILALNCCINVERSNAFFLLFINAFKLVFDLIDKLVFLFNRVLS